MPFHHVTAGLLYKGNYLSHSLSEDNDSDQLASISVEELDEIREAFRVLDRDGNGFISKQELGMAMRSLGYMPSEVELAIIMQRLDMDGDGQVDFDEFMTILGPKLLSSETREGFLGSTIDSIFWQFDMQRITLEELKHILFHAFRDHLTMKDIENIIINEEESLNENSGHCQADFEGSELSRFCSLWREMEGGREREMEGGCVGERESASCHRCGRECCTPLHPSGWI
ncbi:calcium-binding protein 8 isoform X3 [Oncorhynchus mykiss]|uniref:Calneuron 1 n=2 Tax=Oncorhynchus mykiss TaxID=8022 RepID=A0A8C7TH85_ONCMY|nr:calcium-binding protein 8 isoform X3 [Oncorhynchus mykiss]